MLLDPFDVVPNDPVFKPELAHLWILRARAGDALEQAIRLSHQPLYPLLVGLARYVDHSSPRQKLSPPAGVVRAGNQCVVSISRKRVEKYPLPVSRQQRANGGITCRKEEFYRGVR